MVLDRLVLIAPHPFGNLDQNRSLLLVNLTRQQIENNPPIESRDPVPLTLPSTRTQTIRTNYQYFRSRFHRFVSRGPFAAAPNQAPIFASLPKVSDHLPNGSGQLDQRRQLFR